MQEKVLFRKYYTEYNVIIEETCPKNSHIFLKLQSKKISNDQELIQSDPTSCPQNQKGNNKIHKLTAVYDERHSR